MNKFDKPYRTQPLYDNKKIIDLFNRVAKLDTHELLQYSLINQLNLDVTNEDGDTLIHEIINVDNKKATEKIKLDIIKFLIQNNVNPDLPNKNNKTPLHYACFYQYEKIIEYLLSFNANSNYQDNFGYTPLHYLFLGNIKTYNNKSNIEDFIPSIITNNNDNILLDIKMIMLKIINSKINNLPIFNTLVKTINNLFIDNNDIKNIETKYIKYLESLINNNNNNNNISDINENIFLLRNDITKYIKQKFNNFNKSILLKIHKSKPDSWSHMNTDYSIIESGDKKKWFKKNLNNFIFQIINENNSYIPINLNESIDGEYVFSKVIDNLQHLRITDYNVPNRVRKFKYNYKIFNEQYIPSECKSTYDNLLYINALDYASDIIDIENLKLMGGPRDITIFYPPYNNNNNNKYNFEFINQESLLLNNLNNNNKKILYLLCGPISYDTLYDQNNNNVEDFLIQYYNNIKINRRFVIRDFDIQNIIDCQPHITNLRRDLYNNNLWYKFMHQINNIDILTDNLQFNIITNNNNSVDNNFFVHDYCDMIIYMTFSYYSIINPDKMIDLINSKNMKIVLYNFMAVNALDVIEITADLNSYHINHLLLKPFCNNFFAIKWYNIYINKIIPNKKLLGPWILSMWYDLMSKYSNSNLRCYVPFRLLMLISYLININQDNINNTNILSNIFLSYKPQLIEQYFYEYNHILNNNIIIDNILLKINYNNLLDIIPNILITLNYQNILYISINTINSLKICLSNFIYNNQNFNTFLINLCTVDGVLNNLNYNTIYYIILVITIIIINSSPSKENNIIKIIPRIFIQTPVANYSLLYNTILFARNKKIKKSEISYYIIAIIIKNLCQNHINTLTRINDHRLNMYIYNFIIHIFTNDIITYTNFTSNRIELEPGINNNIDFYNYYDNNNINNIILLWIEKLLMYTDTDNIMYNNIYNILFAILNDNNRITNTCIGYSNFEEIYYIYKSNYKNNIDIVCAMILDYYTDLKYSKPFKQTILDTIFILQKTYFYKYIDKNDEKLYSIIDDLMKLNSHNISNSDEDETYNIFTTNVLPSFYGFYNCIKINKNKYNTKYELSHILGLYYEGTIQEIKLFNKFKYRNNDLLLIPPNDTIGNLKIVGYGTQIFDDNNHYHEIEIDLINIDLINIKKGSVPLPLNYLIKEEELVPNRLLFYNYYYCINNCYIAPTYNLYFYTILKNIDYYQKIINSYLIKINNIISLFSKGKMKKINYIYILLSCYNIFK